MRYLSACSGIEAVTVAWRPLGFQAVAFSEIEPFPCALLQHHYPNVPNVGDMTKIDGRLYRGTVDIVVGGTPCQDFSIAGTRQGLAGERSGLALSFVSLVDAIKPKWIVWENVPGVFSTNNGRDFGTFIKALDDIRYSCAWRILDAQYFGVPQRRRRVFLVGHLGDWRPAAAVLFEPDSLRGDTRKVKKAQKDHSGTITSGTGRRRGSGMQPEALTVAKCVTARGAGGENMDSETANFIPVTQFGEVAGTLTDRHDSSPCADRGQNIILHKSAVRRLTPLECERLQGFPDNYTQVPFRGKPACDGPRYKALGNSMAVPVVRWIGERIKKYAKQRRHQDMH